MAKLTPTEALVLRGMHLVMRATFSPNEPTAQAKHFAQLTTDLGPWFTDYATAIADDGAEPEKYPATKAFQEREREEARGAVHDDGKDSM